MLFNSFNFLIFLPIVVILYYSTKQQYRWIVLLFCSYFFYMCWKVEFVLLIMLSTLVDYFVAKKIHSSTSIKKRKVYLSLSLIVNLGLLVAYKYLDFFTGNFNWLFDLLAIKVAIPYMNLLLPVGISFYTFQTLSYTIDVYNRKLNPEKHLGKFAVFVSFWPQLVAGPIERATHLLPELSKHTSLNYYNIRWGLTKIVYGFFKKVVIADRLSVYVNAVYGNLEEASSIGVIFAVLFFSIQIYCDFSGYSDIAIGSAKLMGIDLMENFKRPYLAKSFSDFWRRWHISLSSWFRDYVYIPIGGSRVVKWRWYYNLLLTFVVSGMWHGANWTFILWGALHGMYQVVENNIKGKKGSMMKWIISQIVMRRVIVFTFVCIAWVFFRAENITDAILVFQKILFFDFNFNLNQVFAYKGVLNFLLSIGVIGLLFLSYLIKIDLNIKHHKSFILLGLLLIFFLGKNGDAEFIYFQF